MPSRHPRATPSSWCWASLLVALATAACGPTVPAGGVNAPDGAHDPGAANHPGGSNDGAPVTEQAPMSPDGANADGPTASSVEGPRSFRLTFDDPGDPHGQRAVDRLGPVQEELARCGSPDGGIVKLQLTQDAAGQVGATFGSGVDAWTQNCVLEALSQLPPPPGSAGEPLEEPLGFTSGVTLAW